MRAMSEQRHLPQEAGYNLRMRHPDFEEYFAVWAARSAQVRDSFDCVLDVRYGAGPNMTADLFPAPAEGAPIQVFIHGGYWRAMDKDVHSFPAEGFVAAGGAAVSLNYALAPAVTIDTIVEQCRSAQSSGSPTMQAGSTAILTASYVSGHSAGGHLTAMMLCTDWASARAPWQPGEGRHRHLRHLRPGAAHGDQHQRRYPARLRMRQCCNSPINNLPVVGAPLIAAVGAAETPEFVAQNRAFAEAWQARGFEAAVMEIESLHHFNVVMEMGRSGSSLTQAALAQMGL